MTRPITIPPPSPLLQHWPLEDSTVFLNHGSFGATPHEVLRVQNEWRLRIERELVRFMVEELEPALDAARAELSPIIGAQADDWAFVPNATVGVNTVARSLRLSPGDELITSTQEYNACSNALQWCADRAGAKVVRVALPFPLRSSDEVSAPILAAITPRTKLVLLSATTSPTGYITPFASLVRGIQSRGVDVMLDAAHGPGFMPLDVDGVGAAYTTGNFHKWLCAPKGSAFLHVRRDKHASIDPWVISHGFNSSRTDRSRFRLQFDFQGTVDFSSYLATPAAMHYVPTLVAGGTWPHVMKTNHALVLRGRDLLCRELGTEPPVPDTMLASMAAIMLPAHEPALDERLRARPTKYGDALWDTLVAKHRVQVPIIRMPNHPGRWVRISAQVYTTFEQYQYLAEALKIELAEERSL